MITLKTISTAEPLREHLTLFKQYASVADNSRDAVLLALLRTAFGRVQEAADTSLIPSTLEVSVNGGEECISSVRLYQHVSEIEFVHDGAGRDVEYTLDGRMMLLPLCPHSVTIRYKTCVDGASAEQLLPVVMRYATALYDGETTETLNAILHEC